MDKHLNDLIHLPHFMYHDEHCHTWISFQINVTQMDFCFLQKWNTKKDTIIIEQKKSSSSFDLLTRSSGMNNEDMNLFNVFHKIYSISILFNNLLFWKRLFHWKDFHFSSKENQFIRQHWNDRIRSHSHFNLCSSLDQFKYEQNNCSPFYSNRIKTFL